MAEPSRKTNPELVRDCVAWLLGRISHERGDYTDGMIVRTDPDPRQVIAMVNLEDFKQKPRLVSVRMGRRRRDPQESFYNNKRQKKAFEILVVLAKTEDMEADGLTVDDALERLAFDVTWNLQGDQTLSEAAAALGITPKPSCIALEVDDVVPSPTNRHPYHTAVIRCSYEYEDRPITH
jgi:hypothetical protein